MKKIARWKKITLWAIADCVLVISVIGFIQGSPMAIVGVMSALGWAMAARGSEDASRWPWGPVMCWFVVTYLSLCGAFSLKEPSILSVLEQVMLGSLLAFLTLLATLGFVRLTGED